MVARWLRRSEGPRRTGYTPRRSFGPDTRAIGSGAVAILAEGAEQLGYARADVLAGLEHLAPRLGQFRSKVSWNELRRAMENLERAGLTPAGFEQIGEYGAGSPHLVVARIAEFFTKPQHVLFVGIQWVGPALFPMLRMNMEYGGREIHVVLELPSHLPGSAAYFHVCKGTFASIPSAVGHPRASVHANISSHRAEYDVECPPFSTGLGRMLRIGRAMVSAPLVIRTLAEQEAEVRRSFETAMDTEAQFRRILDALPDAVIIAREGRIAYANPALGRGLGLPHAGEVVGTALVDLFAPALGSSDVLYERADGSMALFELSPEQSILYEGERAILVVAREVTERRMVHNRLALADKMSSLGTLAAGVAHEINNPLALVLTNLQLAARASSDPREYIAAATEGALRVREIVRDLRVFSQPESDDAEAVDLHEVVSSSLALARGKVRARATLEASLDHVPPVRAGRGKLGQVVLNLVINAVQALPASRPVADNRIDVRLREQGGRARIEVEDNGEGIAPDVQGRVFQPFFTTKRVSEGTGLGLAVAHGIVTGYGGELTFHTQPGRGTTFVVELPLAPDAVIDVPPPRDTPVPRTGGRVLLVDDEPALVRVVQQLLADEDYDVVTVGSGNDAMALLDRDPAFDVILCDLMMEHGSGADLYAHVRSARPDMAERIIFMTGGTFRQETRDFLARVSNPCLDKPFNLDELIQTVAHIVHR